MREIKEIESKEGEATGRLAQIHERLVEIDADAKPSQAAEILHGLGSGLINLLWKLAIKNYYDQENWLIHLNI